MKSVALPGATVLGVGPQRPGGKGVDAEVGRSIRRLLPCVPFILPVDYAAREHARLHELRCYEVLSTLSEPVLDDITNLAAHLCGTPIALISLVDENRLWFKARTGLDATDVPRTTALV